MSIKLHSQRTNLNLELITFLEGNPIAIQRINQSNKINIIAKILVLNIRIQMLFNDINNQF